MCSESESWSENVSCQCPTRDVQNPPRARRGSRRPIRHVSGWIGCVDAQARPYRVQGRQRLDGHRLAIGPTRSRAHTSIGPGRHFDSALSRKTWRGRPECHWPDAHRALGDPGPGTASLAHLRTRSAPRPCRWGDDLPRRAGRGSAHPSWALARDILRPRFTFAAHRARLTLRMDFVFARTEEAARAQCVVRGRPTISARGCSSLEAYRGRTRLLREPPSVSIPAILVRRATPPEHRASRFADVANRIALESVDPRKDTAQISVTSFEFRETKITHMEMTLASSPLADGSMPSRPAPLRGGRAPAHIAFPHPNRRGSSPRMLEEANLVRRQD